MNNIGRIFNKATPATGTNVYGVEVELEGFYNGAPVCEGWFVEHDGSLRDGGLEFVMKNPLTLADTQSALAKLKSSFDKVGTVPKETNLASSHIHINVTDLTTKQLLEFIGVVMMFEKDIAINSGLDRYHNYFALGSSESDMLQRKLSSVLKDEDLILVVSEFSARDLRYSGINIASILKYGSLEMRYLGSNPDPRNIYKWVEFYDNIKKEVLKGINFEEIFRSISVMGLDLVKDKFKPPFEMDGENILQGVRIAQDVVYGVSYKFSAAPNDGNGVMDYFNKNGRLL